MREIEESFSELGLTPRDGQVEVCRDIVLAFEAGKSCVFVDAPTGSGKSVVAVVVAKAMGRRATGTKSVIVSSTNALVRQYRRDFSSAPGVVPLFGADNYRCSLRTSLSGKQVSAEKCYRKSKFFEEQFAGTELEAEHCGNCEFRRSRDRKVDDQVVVTNYAYFAIDRLYLETLAEGRLPTFRDRELFVFDEAHLFNEQFASHCTVHTSARRLKESIEDLRSLLGPDSGAERAYSSAFGILLDNVRRETIGPRNVGKFLSTLMKFYGLVHGIARDAAREATSEADYDRRWEVGEKYRRLLCKVEDYFEYDLDVAVTCEPRAEELTVKPIFAGQVFGALRSRYNLFMSATLDPAYMARTLMIDQSEAAEIRAPYRFEPDDKRIRVPDRGLTIAVSYRNSRDSSALGRLAETCSMVLREHRHQSGIVVSTSFAMAREVASRVSSDHAILLHEPSARVDDLVEALRVAGRPTVLFSPSLFEGIDLPGDASRFQVLLKAPYYSLADRRMTAIMRNHPDVYDQMTVMRLVQVLGRSTRFRGDKSTSYFLDRNLERVFDSRNNRWTDQFEVTKGWKP